MKKKDQNIAYEFTNPNTPQEMERLLRRIIIDKLLSQKTPEQHT